MLGRDVTDTVLELRGMFEMLGRDVTVSVLELRCQD